MKIEECRQKLLSVAGLDVVLKQVVGNSLQLWFGVSPQSEHAIALWVDPPWRVQQTDMILSTSNDMAWEPYEGESDAQYKEREAEAWKMSNPVSGRKVADIQCLPPAHDLILKFGEGLEIRSFSIFADSSSWNIRFYSENLRICGWRDRIAREPIDTPH